MRADQKIGACDADNLFIDGKFPVDAAGVTIASGEGVLARGTVVAMSSKTKKNALFSAQQPEKVRRSHRSAFSATR